MKKFISITVALLLFITPILANAVALEIDGEKTDCSMLFENSTAYVPLSSAAKVMGCRIDWDKATNSVFVNGINLFAQAGDTVKVYINGSVYDIPKDELQPIVQNGEVYLPAHLAADAFGKTARWYEETATLVFSSDKEVVNFTPAENVKYVIINNATGQALTVTEEGLTTQSCTKGEGQQFTFVPTAFEGYYHIRSVSNGKNLDVYEHGTVSGAKIITWEQGDGDNQKFSISPGMGGVKISARSCHLPLEPYKNMIIQNSDTDLPLQTWTIAPVDTYSPASAQKAKKLVINYTPPKEEEKTEYPYRTFTIGDDALTDSSSLKCAPYTASASQKWTVSQYSEGVYVITNQESGKSIDVNARSLEEGGSIITWQTSSDTNQRWIFEQNGDGTYYIKSVHSVLYLTLKDDGSLIQSGKNAALKQRWNINGVN